MDRRRTSAVHRLVIGLALCLLAGCGQGDDDRPLEVAPVRAVGCDRPQPRLGVGTFVADGIVLTAAHVVEGDLRELRVGDAPAAVVGIDVESDLALVTTLGAADAAPEWTVLVPAGRVSGTEPGPVQIMSPDGAVEADLIRTLTLRVDDISDDTLTERAALELDVVVDEGDSGSPVVDADGALLGIVVLRRAAAGVSYASAVPPFTDIFDQALYQDIRAGSLAGSHACT